MTLPTFFDAAGERAPSPVETIGQTADFAYVRLRASGKDVYAYFRHDDDGSNGVSAEQLRDALA